ncbi:hypothetical protein CPLU01_13398 [Colletotrichum plurivorum]|uniref:Protein kinase domain-containing protein n=1 Tax=Colletotrichum plurivorum TaxID=2175906 RepID=A0A8H6JS39_9PEZI|nr:hypothetical protein CPLU01_13398 [Colletotrichum plurivorum]
MEPIGLGLGSVSLLFQVFAGCIKGYQLLSEARGLEKNHQYFRVKFKTEQCRLLDWANVVDLSEDEATLTMNRASRAMILQILDEQYRLMFRFGRLDDRLRPISPPILYEETDAAETQASAHDAQDKEKADALQARFPDKTLLLEKSLRFFQNTTKYPARLRWAISDKAKIEEILNRLAGLNDYLNELLNSQQLQALGTQQMRTNYHIMQLNDKIDDLCEIVKAGLLASASAPQLGQPNQGRHWQTMAGSQISASPVTTYERTHDTQLASLAQVKGLMSAIDTGALTDQVRQELSLQQTDVRTLPMKLGRTDLRPIQPSAESFSQRWPAWYKPSLEPWRKVWIEWKSSEPRQQQMGIRRSNSMMLSRFEALVQLLREDAYTAQFRALKCLGYYVQEVSATENRLGLVFENPPRVDSSVLPITLLDLLQRRSVPSLSARLKLIKILVDCVERLHAVNWLHKGLRSQNILFFCDVDSEPDYAQPFLSGFDYSRPESADFMSEVPPHIGAEDLYRHPAVQGGPRDDTYGFGFKKHHDIYSLGIIILEIIYWKPIEVVLRFGEEDIGRSSETARVKEILLGGTFDEDNRRLMGDAVGDVVRSCLTGPDPSRVPVFGADASKSGTKLQEWFFDAVVKRLRELRI